MKRVTLALLLLFSITTFAQQGINYKALIKDGGGTVIASQMITVQFQILQGAGMTNVYQETHTPTTDATGIVIINIGEVATPDSGVFADIDWGSDTHFLNTKINTGAGLVDMGTTGFKAVPYALSSKKTESVSGTANFIPKFNDGSSVGDSQIFDDGTNVGIGTATPTSKMDLRATEIGLRQQSSETGASIGFYTIAGAAWLQTHNDFPLRFATNNFGNAMTLNTNGNLGIGVTTAIAKLDVAGDIKIADGTQGVGKVLTSDADGLASWDTETDPRVPQGTTTGEMQYWNGSDWVLVTTSINEGATLQLIGGIPTWIGGAVIADVIEVTSATGEIWMDRNLGAAQVATSGTDTDSYGDLYQWGRGADGHQIRTSSISLSLSTFDTPGHGEFILSPSGLGDWRNPQNGTLWQGVNGVNNPCPTGYRLPTEAELNEERLSWSSNNDTGAYNSPLKLPVAGYRTSSSGLLFDVGSYGLYWSSTVNGSNSRNLYFGSGFAFMTNDYRANGFSVRCIKD